MHNLLILYNPYYQEDVIDQHLKVLQDRGQVAFGKVRSRLNNQVNPYENELQEIYKNVSEQNPLQLFLSDYANLFVAKVIKVVDCVDETLIPDYYQQKKLEVECYFVISDLMELVRENFTLLRDKFLANFTTLNNNYTYAIYGNSYVYPLIVKQKQPILYFDDEEDSKHFLSVYKSDAYLQLQENLIHFVFGKNFFYLLHPSSIENLVSAELELKENINNPLYDFTSIIVKYSKTLEYEIYSFSKVFFGKLCEKNSELLKIEYEVQGKKYCLEDFFSLKPNIGTIKFLFRHPKIQELLDSKQKYFVFKELSEGISLLQKVRNQAVHEKAAGAKEVNHLRSEILGVGSLGILKALLKQKEKQ